ncbi:hypothetical protein BH23DEI1_BH23DEI1_20030 [soil metagenome]
MTPALRRLTHTIGVDLRLQRRNGLPVFTAVALILLVAVVRTLLPPDLAQAAMPGLLFMFVGATAFAFASAQVLFERGDRTLDALAVTPLRTREYLLSKLITLAGLATLEGTLFVLLTLGVTCAFPLLLAGIVIQGALATVTGLVVVARYRSVTNFLITSPLFVTPLFLPIVTLVSPWHHPLLYLWPTMPALVLFEGAITGIRAGQLLYALAFGATVVVAGLAWSRAAFDAHVLRTAA